MVRALKRALNAVGDISPELFFVGRGRSPYYQKHEHTRMLSCFMVAEVLLKGVMCQVCTRVNGWKLAAGDVSRAQIRCACFKEVSVIVELDRLVFFM